MSIYFSNDVIRDLISHRDIIFAEAKKSHAKYGIDILSNDILSSLSMWEIIIQYDSEYKPNFHRNGEDGMSGTLRIERKCCTKAPNKKNRVTEGGWQFHAQETDKSDRYIFAIRRKDNLQIVRMYDIMSPNGIALVKQFLIDGRQKWIDKGKPNHDAIVFPEKNLGDLQVTQLLTINNCEVFII